ncbi:GCN5-related N-acetyltransferase [Alloactinosynnema sp. L-07]|uniref:hypothetical protein n=1 Tax=Alloactinosynnema sp. L-07 TaxID=1653480 RepID=UPI00065EFDDC|nr:hypothetical protein [Alloactinosynnema sp. L-07]CRK62119.1 GCN5-related N-acetyltransferase [Alloactinosynnema sp. L-07]
MTFMDIPGRAPSLPEPHELPTGVRLATAADEAALITLLSASFQEDPLTKWILPDPVARRAALPGFFEVFVELALTHGGILLGGDFETALLFTSPVATEFADERAEEIQWRLSAAVGGGGAASMLLTILGMQASHHPTDRAHYYISFAGVRPDRQRRGILTGMIAPLLHLADRQGYPIYTEASSAGGAAAALRFGFTPIGSVITLPNGPALRPLWRDPR